MAFLNIESGALSGRRIEVGTEPVTIGRSPDCTIVLDDTGVSSHHCRLERKEDDVLLIDEDSTNGTILNDEPVKEESLKDGDVVIVGPVFMTFRTAAMEEAAAPAVEDMPNEESQEIEDTLELTPWKQTPAAVADPDLFKPRRPKNLVALPVYAVIGACLAIAGVFFLRRLFY